MDFEALERLGRLRDSGAITPDEFEAEKHRILGTHPATLHDDDIGEESNEVVASYDSREPKRRPLLVIGLAIIAIAAVGFFAFKFIASGTPEDALADEATATVSSGPTERSPYRVSSTVDGIRAAATTVLPSNPDKNPIDEYCTDFVIEPKSSGGKIAQSQGWHLTSEATVGDLQAVSFAGDFEPGTSGACFVQDGNVAFFNGDELVAIAYGESMGTIESLASGTRGRIWSQDIRYAAAVADVELEDASIRIVPLSKSDFVCSGNARVPNIFGSSIGDARRVTAQAGWKPTPQTDEPDPRTGDLRSAGITEAATCSGTGYGLCEFIYENDSGSTLTVTSVGDDPTVLNYGVDCAQ